jgi:hypothetical protein
MNALHYIGFDVHKKTISFCVKTAAGGRRRGGSATPSAAGVGRDTAASLAGRAGSDPVQRLDLRHLAALQRVVGDCASCQDEGHQRGQEEERHPRLPHQYRVPHVSFYETWVLAAVITSRGKPGDGRNVPRFSRQFFRGNPSTMREDIRSEVEITCACGNPNISHN